MNGWKSSMRCMWLIKTGIGSYPGEIDKAKTWLMPLMLSGDDMHICKTGLKLIKFMSFCVCACALIFSKDLRLVV